MGDYGSVDKQTGNFAVEGNIFKDFLDLRDKVGDENKSMHENDCIVAPASGGAVEDVTTSIL